jgi:hypothetical protein
MKRDGETYILKSGRAIHAHRGILGLEPGPVEAWESRLTHGFDGVIDSGRETQDDEDAPRILTADERRELAEHMIGQWARWGGIRYVNYAKEPPEMDAAYLRQHLPAALANIFGNEDAGKASASLERFIERLKTAFEVGPNGQ